MNLKKVPHMRNSKLLQGRKGATTAITLCFSRADFVAIPSYIEVSWLQKF